MAAPLRILAIDDEPLALRRIEIALTHMDDVRLVGTARDGPEALEAIDRLKPDVLLLDIRMNGMTGFDVVAALTGKDAPHVVFVTAYDAFATRAFEVSAVDYVLKPVDFDRLRAALGRCRERVDAADARDREAELRALIEALRAPSRELETQDRFERELWVPRRGEFVRLAVDDIEWIGAERDYVRLNSPHGSFLIRETMAGMIDRLDPERFLRVHRSTIVQRRHIESLQPTGYGRLRLRLQSGAELSVGRFYTPKIKEMLTAFRRTSPDDAAD